MSTATHAADRRPAEQTLDALIVGAGFGGVAAAIELRRHGFGELKILEKAPDLGGTWFYNGYPGAACDVPSHLYSFSYAQREDWSRLCSPQQEILDYLHETARTYDVDGLVETNTTVSSCAWDPEQSLWHIDSEDGRSYSARVLILATGQLHKAQIPAIDGASRFTGRSFHSAAWEHSYPLEGKRVAVIGTGASAVQFVPEIAARASSLKVFQRTGNWFLPRKNRPYPAFFKAIVRHVPGVQAWRRKFVFYYTESLTLAIRHPRTLGRLLALRSAAFMRAQLHDPEVRRKAWPDYTFGCKRILFSSDFLPALQRENVELLTEHIERIEPEGIVTADGAKHAVDCIIWATGFETTRFMFPMQITGAGGRDLGQFWREGAHAHLGITVPGFPNMFILYGPNTNTSGGSIIFYLETQSAYIRQAMQELRRRHAASIEVRAEVEAASDRELQARFAGTAWIECDSWYRNERGRIVANWPGYMREYRARLARLEPAEYAFAAAVPSAVAARA